MLKLPPREVYRKIVAAGRMAEELGAKILGLGAYTAVVGDGGRAIAQELDIAVTTGDSYTAAVAIQAVHSAVERMGIDLQQTTTAVVGATGAVGGVVARKLAREVGRILLVGRRRDRLADVGELVQAETSAEVALSVDINAIREAQVVVTVTSAGGNLIRPEHLQRGAVVCDVSRPRDVSWQVKQARDDLLVFDGGLVQVPGAVDFGFNYGPPPNMTFGCVAETMALAFEGQFEDYTLGKDISLEKVNVIEAMAAKHGFELAALRSFERQLDDAMVEKVKLSANARDKNVIS